MPSPEAQTVELKQPASRPWLALALTFLLLGVGFSLPFPLVKSVPSGIWSGAISPEVLNLYALTAFAGWAHFLYAGRGQWGALARLKWQWRAGYWALVAAALTILVGLRALLGIGLFSALVWIWFIAHFVKAEVVFAGDLLPRSRNAWRTAWSPVVSFAWLTVVLFDAGHIQQHRSLLLACTIILAFLVFGSGGWQQLFHGGQKLALVSLFFLGESLVWGTYGAYMTPAFRTGVYVFHVAGASFFHYMGSYAFGRYRTRDRLLAIGPILVVNLVVIVLGWVVAAAWSNPANQVVQWALTPVLGIGWFTLWVALHLAASDLLPGWRKRAKAAHSA
jgi:FtsH-binding integral membrane protein